MCVSKDNLLNQAKEANHNNAVRVAAALTTSSSNSTNWSQLFRKPLKPKLPRKIVSSARTNINKYWNKFEEMLTSDYSVNTKSNTFNSHCKTRTSYRLMPPSMLLTPNKRSSYVAPPSPPPSPVLSSQPFDHIDAINMDQNNIQDEINQLISKRFVVEKNVARSSMYKHFSDESLYHGVNLNMPARQRCSCADMPILDMSDLKRFPFHHRNLQLSFEDQENLDNEAMEVYTNFGYDISF